MEEEGEDELERETPTLMTSVLGASGKNNIYMLWLGYGIFCFASTAMQARAKKKDGEFGQRK